MANQTYEGLVESLKIKDLGDFLKSQSDIVTLTGWSKMKAPEKKQEFLDALPQSEDLRKNFVAFYNDLMETEITFAALEGDDAGDGAETETETEPGQPDLLEGTATEVVAANPEAFNVSKGGTVAHSFVEGDFGKIVSDASGLTAEQTSAALRACEDDLELQHMRIGVLIMRAHDAQHYMALGYENMRAFIAGETGLEYRKAMQLARNARIVQEVGISEKELKGVTWAALRHILPVIKADNYNHWLDAARSMKHASLIAAVNEQKAKDAGALPAPEGDGKVEKPEASQKVFNVYPDQKATIDEALKKAKIEANTDAMGAALEAMAASYIGKPVSGSTISAVMPDTSPDGLKKIFSKMNEDEGAYAAAMAVLTAFEEIWPGVTLEVEFPKDMLPPEPAADAAE